MSNIALSQLCTPDTFIRSTLFSDIFHAAVSLDGIHKEVDIQRYEFPFCVNRINHFKTEYNMSDDDFPALYRWLFTSLRRSVEISASIHQERDFETGMGQSFERYIHQARERREDGTTVFYMLTDPKERYLDYIKCPDNKISLTEVLRIGAILSRTINKLNQREIHVGLIDLDNMAILKWNAGERTSTYKCVCNLLYATQKDEVRPYFDKIFPNTTPEELKNGDMPGDMSDAKAIALLLKAIVTRHYQDNTPLAAAVYSRDVPRPLEDAIEAVLAGELGLRGLYKSLTDLDKRNKNWKDAEKIMYPIDRSCYDFYTVRPIEDNDSAAVDQITESQKQSTERDRETVENNQGTESDPTSSTGMVPVDDAAAETSKPSNNNSNEIQDTDFVFIMDEDNDSEPSQDYADDDFVFIIDE